MQNDSNFARRSRMETHDWQLKSAIAWRAVSKGFACLE
jgi:hypothetical protein